MHNARAETTCAGYIREIPEDADKMIASLIEELRKPAPKAAAGSSSIHIEAEEKAACPCRIEKRKIDTN